MFYHYDSPIGPLTLESDGDFLTHIHFGTIGDASEVPSPVLLQTERELDEYFLGSRKEFTVPLKMDGTPFQMACWEALKAIPYGETRTYGDIAAAVGRPKAVRAVGMANNVNSIPIIVPCHRVIGKDGNLRGYAGSVPAKICLLQIEGAL